MNLKWEQIFLLIIILVIVISGSVLLIRQTIRKNEFVTVGLRDENSQQIKSEPESEFLQKGVEGVEEKTEETKYIYVHITGAVKNSGVYKLKKNARVVDALEAAGGGSEKAVLSRVNLAQRIADGEQIYIPDKGDINLKENTVKLSDNIHRAETGKETKIAINRADRSQLQKLPGIGPSKAKNIIEYRNKIGRFDSFEQLLAVKGIGEKTLDKMKSELSLK